METNESERFDSIVSEMQDHAVMKAEDAFYDYDAWLKLCNRLRTAHRRELANIAEMRKALESVLDDYAEECPIADMVRDALSDPYRNCDRFTDELDAQIAFLNEVWLISVSKETMIEKDKFENWTEQMKERYGRWLMEQVKEKE